MSIRVTALQRKGLSAHSTHHLTSNMPTAYKVKRHEPLSVSDITVTFDINVRELSSNNVSSDDNTDGDTDDDNDDDDYCVKSIHAAITGRETVSGRQVTLGDMSADLLEVQKAMRTCGLW